MNIILIILLIGLDQITKYFALKYLSQIGSISIIENIFNLTYVENKGAAFGILQNQKWFFVLVATSVVIFILYYLFYNKKLSIYTRISLILILSGAIGNLIDRVRLNFVVDFFDFIIWPVFNMADIYVVVGGILLSYTIISGKE
ncbi:signal peptidase II [Tepidibacter formicigenes]|uniref:Lipoprotein signal peptidase n=1 Tax=Tepidibacter formicigenes DSM 15518 TaxID=1123349 RepID=A0A1M6KFC3_9FIRM|nr:signal peptidase II [Tepidibacter formicigenes]SHJ57683.1 signal peptidase II [Tepidibacter formicigenes DSM 15518]